MSPRSFSRGRENKAPHFDKHMSQLAAPDDCPDDSACIGDGLPNEYMKRTEIFNMYTYVQRSLQWRTHTHTRVQTKSSHGLEPGSSVDHAAHPHPLSKKPEVNSFPYSLLLSHPDPSHTHIAPITASGANSRQTLFSTKCSNLKFPLRTFGSYNFQQLL